MVSGAEEAGDSRGAGPRRRITVLGATGSVGRSTCDLLARDPERFAVEALTANRDVAALADLAISLRARATAIADPAVWPELRDRLAGTGIEALGGPEGVIEAASRPADIVVSAIVGAAGLAPTLAALRSAPTVALANKECLVCAGAFFMDSARRAGATVLPVDSEHNAIFQVLEEANRDFVEEIVLTASGGPFRGFTREQLRHVTRQQALRHPKWSMGAKITIDSATLMNKGLELIEAHHLFAVPAERLGVLVHPQSVVHGLVRYRDGSLLAQLGSPDMRTPIACCLAWPARMAAPVAPLDLARLGTLTFEAPDRETFPCLGLAEAAMARGGGAATVLNAANEVAVAEFLADRLGYLQIAAVVEETLSACESRGLSAVPASLDDALDLDAAARHKALEAVTPSRARRGDSQCVFPLPNLSRTDKICEGF
ncbi:1-deoxy-D-xylulose-5-phosphate reductoisomerase [Methylobrevis pamukkalensis]|uniref:1-deoxy-D-xylulose 5-phosphate reductoisomerase n=1 Tax=Methylobrevis pamukkalensis TaxID=1439726 RepID=A0A1E3H5R6_9HYPH|nr:1-deoxy-D-xylulose-5-phosphate reductoisomerase [Methylobrevis pamukkalensis]ODN71146.1 1-deoxy-D-xylulose 5-phosphate reductoisomerase [Methylobrevis pamukkalensis]